MSDRNGRHGRTRLPGAEGGGAALRARRAFTTRHVAALAAAACCALALSASAGRESALLSLEDEPAPAPVRASVLGLDFDPKTGATVIGLTASGPLLHHTVYEPDSRTIVVDVPAMDVASLPALNRVGTREVEAVHVESPGTSGLARFRIVRAEGTRREVAVDPRNPNRLEITVLSAPEPAAGKAPAIAAAPPARQLASAAGPQRAAAVPRVLESPTVPVTTSVRLDAAPVAQRGSAPMLERRSVPTPMSSSPSGVARLEEATITKAADGRVLLRLVGSRELTVNAFVLDAPPRLALDLPHTINDVRESTLAVRAGGVLRVRLAQHEPLPQPVTRLVVDLERDVPYEIERGPDAVVVVLGSSTGVPMASSEATPPASRRAARESERPAPMQRGAGSAFAGTAMPDEVPMREAQAPSSAMVGNVPQAIQTFQTVEVSAGGPTYTGEPISINVKDADLEDLFRLFAEIADLNIVLDQAVKGKTITLVLDDVPWDQALALVLKTNNLGSTLDGNVLRIAPLNKLAQEEQQKKALVEARELAGDMRLITRVLSYADANTVSALVRRNLSSRGTIDIDRRMNMMIIKDLPGRLTEIERLIVLLDQPTRQVMIEARVVETTKDFSKTFGINWGFNYIADRAFGNTTGFSFPRSVSSDFAVNLPGLGNATTLGLSFRNILNTFALDIALQAQEDRGRARVVSRPMIMVQNNESANIESGVQIPITTTTATEVDVTFVSASLKLQVKPQITADNTVIMDIQVENNSPTFITGTDNASIATRQAKTVVAVADGGTTVIGGIYIVNEGVNTTRTPLLSRIPLLGWLFRNKNITKTNDELLIFLTPKIQKG